MYTKINQFNYIEIKMSCLYMIKVEKLTNIITIIITTDFIMAIHVFKPSTTSNQRTSNFGGT